VPADLTPSDRAELEKIVRQLEAAWNAMDSAAFAVPFAAQTDLVNIRGEHFRGRRDAVAPGIERCSRESMREAGTSSP
jgi:uncharacterized protein (TIGR02246 family)